MSVTGFARLSPSYDYRLNQLRYRNSDIGAQFTKNLAHRAIWEFPYRNNQGLAPRRRSRMASWPCLALFGAKGVSHT